MPRPKKDYAPITVKLSKDVYDRLGLYCDIAGQTKTVAVERAITLFIDAYEKKENIKIDPEKTE